MTECPVYSKSIKHQSKRHLTHCIRLYLITLKPYWQSSTSTDSSQLHPMWRAHLWPWSAQGREHPPGPAGLHTGRNLCRCVACRRVSGWGLSEMYHSSAMRPGPCMPHWPSLGRHGQPGSPSLSPRTKHSTWPAEGWGRQDDPQWRRLEEAEPVTQDKGAQGIHPKWQRLVGI